MVILVMGVAGVGKTTVGSELARQLGWPFVDADEEHSPANIKKMRVGIPLGETDRVSWLAGVRRRLERHRARGEDVVLACSALKQAHRDYLEAGAGKLLTIYLHAPGDVVARRLTLRPGHFAGPELLASQYRALEPPHDAVPIDASHPLGDVIATIRAHLPQGA